MADREETYVLDCCGSCPSLWEWPRRNLIVGSCPQCGKSVPGREALRALKAQRLIEGIPDGRGR